MRWLSLILCLVAGIAQAQTREVAPRDLSLTVTVENAGVTPYRQEMVLITIHGVYRRHVTRETLEQPDLDGFNWMQLGEDEWFDSRIAGQKVKNFRRRMALFPERDGRIEIGPFVHHLTLTDEEDDWFEHDIRSEPLTIEVAPLPAHEGWWFPTRRLEISDTWSNAPDQLQPGDGVLRVIRLQAVGAAPEMLPPMPELTSPSAMIFPHPERRFVELSPEGPVAYAFWRWTIRPTNDTSAILEPIEFDYFDTVTRRSHHVRISPQRVAMDEGTLPVAQAEEARATPPRPVLTFGTGAAAFALGLVLLTAGRRVEAGVLRQRIPALDPLVRRMRRAARAGDLPGLRRAAAALARREGWQDGKVPEIARLDSAIFGRGGADPDPHALVRALTTRARESG